MRNLIVLALMVCFACGGTDGTNTGDIPNGTHGQDPNNGGGSSGGSPNAGTGGNAGSGGSNATGGSGGSAGSSNAGSGGSAGSGGDDGGNTGGSAGSGGNGGSSGDDAGMTDDGSTSDDGGGMGDDASNGHPDATVPPPVDGGTNQDGSCHDGGSDAGQCGITCTRTQGYYANHPNVWRYSSLTLGLTSYTEAQCLTFLASPTNGDASLIFGGSVDQRHA